MGNVERNLFWILIEVARVAVLWRLFALRGTLSLPSWGAYTLYSILRTLALRVVGPTNSPGYRSLYLVTDVALIFLTLLVALEVFGTHLPGQTNPGRIWLRRTGILMAAPLSAWLFATLAVETWRSFLLSNLLAIKVAVFVLSLAFVGVAMAWANWTGNTPERRLRAHAAVVVVLLLVECGQVIARKLEIPTVAVSLGVSALEWGCWVSWYFAMARISATIADYRETQIDH